ncbi:hypothetical protein [Zavarzinella formosa]|uniref:hypothetical protein n=1 Tax=Zavarzinella formosa TaxID=360055 RepID=UPI0002F69636|nr:hypothetical protein [Zavarzinella formosa]
MKQSHRDEVLKALTKLRVAKELLAEVYNETYPMDVREAIGHGQIIGLLRPMHEHVKKVNEALHAKPEVTPE